ncbi:MAG: hypothetical protein ABFS41_13260, partial [Myxococcota bacterium]
MRSVTWNFGLVACIWAAYMREVYERHYRHDPDMLTNTPELKSDRFDDIRLSSLFSICMEGYT